MQPCNDIILTTRTKYAETEAESSGHSLGSSTSGYYSTILSKLWKYSFTGFMTTVYDK